MRGKYIYRIGPAQEALFDKNDFFYETDHPKMHVFPFNNSVSSVETWIYKNDVCIWILWGGTRVRIFGMYYTVQFLALI